MSALNYFFIFMIATAFSLDETQFPDDFLLGFATSSYSSEGAWNEDGKGINIWDTLTHNHPKYIYDRSNGDVADDSYHKYKEDVKILKDLGAQVYKFSLSWSRILPKGTVDLINRPGIDYYNNLINELIAEGITPIVALHAWDLPQPLQDIGGWPNEALSDYFEDYARIAFKSFGDRVKWWITFEDPQGLCIAGYGIKYVAPENVELPGVADYLCGQTILLAHAQAYHLYYEEFESQQKGKIGIGLTADHMEPKTDIAENVQAAKTAFDFTVGWFAHPIFSEEGDYPDVMLSQVSENSDAEGLFRSRLPYADNETIEYVQGTADFLAISHFTTYLIEPAQNPIGPDPSWIRDSRILPSQDASWPSSGFPVLKVVPWGLRKVLNNIKTNYNNPPVIVISNGYADSGELNDTKRIDYHRSYLQELLNAIYEDGCNVFGYTAWSLLDSFVYTLGYTQKFGIYKVDFKHDLKRIPKNSAKFFKTMISSRTIPSKYESGNLLNDL